VHLRGRFAKLTRVSNYQETSRHDPAVRRKSRRAGREKGVHIYIAAAELRAAGIDPDDAAPEFLVYPSNNKGRRLRINLYPVDTATE